MVNVKVKTVNPPEDLKNRDGKLFNRIVYSVTVMDAVELCCGKVTWGS